MSTAVFDNFEGRDGAPANFPHGLNVNGVDVSAIQGRGPFEGKKYRIVVVADDAGNEAMALEEIV
jgi:hypothetical protein